MSSTPLQASSCGALYPTAPMVAAPLPSAPQKGGTFAKTGGGYSWRAHSSSRGWFVSFHATLSAITFTAESMAAASSGSLTDGSAAQPSNCKKILWLSEYKPPFFYEIWIPRDVNVVRVCGGVSLPRRFEIFEISSVFWSDLFWQILVRFVPHIYLQPCL